ncbi:MAG TPA: hypothetical protein VK536_08480 [Candidatus Limnocylindrales bacterium]|nr:hypothetical protein [Candidatus Limnocylindrales bacterium]
MTKINAEALETIGKTPLVKPNRLPQGTDATVVAKLESRTPSGKRQRLNVPKHYRRSRKARSDTGERYLSTILFQESAQTLSYSCA